MEQKTQYHNARRHVEQTDVEDFNLSFDINFSNNAVPYVDKF